MKKQKLSVYVSTAVLALAMAVPAAAMSITNADGEVRQIVVTEGGDRFEQDIAPNETVTICESGCFITFPNGALTAYEGNESIVIRDGGPALPN